MPDDELLTIQPIILTTPVQEIVSRAGVRVNCDACGEEIINEREVILHGRVLCRACGWGSYYASVEQNFPQVELSERLLSAMK